MSQFKIVYAKHVRFAMMNGSNQSNKLIMLITGQDGKEYRHDFDGRSGMYRKFINEETAVLEKSFINAPFVFITSGFGDYKLIDFRDNRYKGHIHTEDVLNRLGDVLGVTTKDKSSGTLRRGWDRSIKDKYGFILGSESTKLEFDVNGQENNAFAATVSFPFDPFSANVGCFIGVERLICLNGMATSSPLFNYKIPILSNVEDNLRVAISQLSPTIQHDMKRYIEKLQHERASIAETQRTNCFVIKRIDTAIQSIEELKRLTILKDITDVQKHCTQYEKEIFEGFNASVFPSHLTRFDLWNVLTEMDSHTKETPESSHSMVQKYINTLVFNSTSSNYGGGERSGFINSKSKFNASHLQAFFGSDSAGF